MNGKGQSIMWGIVVGLMIFISGMLLMNFIKTDADDMMYNKFHCGYVNSTLSWPFSASSINMSMTDGGKLSCLLGEIIVPYFIIIVASVAGGYATERFLM